jgi:hypothetical protein
MAWDGERSHHWHSIRVATSLPNLPVAATAFTVRLTTGQLELAHTGLTSTDVVALAINSTDARVFAGTYSQMGEA